VVSLHVLHVPLGGLGLVLSRDRVEVGVAVDQGSEAAHERDLRRGLGERARRRRRRAGRRAPATRSEHTGDEENEGRARRVASSAERHAAGTADAIVGFPAFRWCHGVSVRGPRRARAIATSSSPYAAAVDDAWEQSANGRQGLLGYRPRVIRSSPCIARVIARRRGSSQMVDHGQGARRGESPDRTGPVVLVVEDEAANRALLETLLSRAGYRVVTM